MSKGRPVYRVPQRRRRFLASLVLVCLIVASGAVLAEVTLPEGFQQAMALTGLTEPTNVEFAPDGRVLIAEKGGSVQVFDDLTDPTPDLLIDLSVAVHDYWDRGLLGMAIDPDFPAQPFVYLFYSYNRDLQDAGANEPTWPDSCPNPPGGTADGCVVDGRLSRVEIAPDNSLVGAEQILLEGNWCQQWPSHSVGDLVFDDSQRVLYLSAGDGAAFSGVDFGQRGGSAGSPTPANPCGDPPGGRGVALSAPSAEGGALRSQDLRTPGDPVGYSGSVLAVDPDNGLPAAGNPLLGGDPGDDRIVAFGLRNPFRLAVRPGADDLWISDVGWAAWEEINRISDPGDAIVENFGWPCYEGPNPQPGYQAQGLTLCNQLYADVQNPARGPFYGYQHFAFVDPEPEPYRCSKSGSSSVTGLGFYSGTSFPQNYDGAMFFADYSRDCIFVMEPGIDGLPDPQTRSAFADGADNPVDLQFGPDEALYYLDIEAGRLMRIDFSGVNMPPVARILASASNGLLPLAVEFNGSTSEDPDSAVPLAYDWDLTGNGVFGDSTAATPLFNYTVQGTYLVQLRVTDDQGLSDTTQLLVTAGNRAPTMDISRPSESDLWRVGETIVFRGDAHDPEDGPLGAASVDWDLILHHCPGGPDDCHTHPIQGFEQTLSGNFDAPDHEYYSFIEIRGRATDGGFPGGGGVLTTETSRFIDPDATVLDMFSGPQGLDISAGSITSFTPFSQPVIIGANVLVTASSPQNLDGKQYGFVSWSDGSAQSHTRTIGTTPLGLSALYEYVGTSTDWWNPNWRRRIQLTLDNSAQTEALIDFPLLVRFNPTRIDYGATMDQGQDLRFVDADGATLLPFEIERWDETGDSQVWVRVPRIDAGSSSDHIWVYFDRDGQSDAQDAAGVWSPDHVGVWHMGASLEDSSGLSPSGTDFGTGATAGWVADARNFDGTAWVDLGSSPALEQTGDVTLEAWIRLSEPSKSGDQAVISKQPVPDGVVGYGLDYNGVEQELVARSSGPDSGSADGVILDTNWHYLVAVIGGARCEIYVDGINRTTDTACQGLLASTDPVNVGRVSGGGGLFSGDIDEVRIVDAERSADWVRAQHLSMTDQLLGYDAPQDNCGPIDAECDAFDDDCDGQLDEDFSGVATTCGLGVCQTAGATTCSAGIVQDTCTPLAPGPDDASCDGLDQDCDGFIDEDTATGAGENVLLFESEVRFVWSGSQGEQYDVLMGDLDTLLTSGGQYSAATTTCLDDKRGQARYDHGGAPPSGAGHWFLVRQEQCGCFCSYDSGESSQSFPRDPGIESSPNACP